jgi:hypothetical protein
VFENECNPTFSFQVNGPDVDFLGRGDFHDHKYESMEISVSVISDLLRICVKALFLMYFQQAWLLDLSSFVQDGKSYTGIPVVNDTCPFHLRLFPSREMESDYKSSDPILFTVCAVLIFAFTSAVFLVYDRLVEKRQRMVMTTAMHTSAIVSSLFPSTVRGRLFEAENEQNGDEGMFQSGSFMAFGDKVVSRPIADLYPSATVMFADMYVHPTASLLSTWSPMLTS